MNQINLPQNAYGKIPYNMTNDYMFRAVLQSNNKVLKGLICSLLHLKESEVQTVKITNPILLGDTVRDTAQNKAIAATYQSGNAGR